jgi:dTDP-4-dehydrorhamnose reductase
VRESGGLAGLFFLHAAFFFTQSSSGEFNSLIHLNKDPMNHSPRLLVIGARGFLGSFVTSRAADTYDVYRGDRTRDSDETDVAIDITEIASVTKAFAEVRPDAVILLSAISDIDRCQRDRQLAISVNLYGAENVANACTRTGARLLFTSTGAVFDGFKHGYTEEDTPTPVSVYGETKAQAELIVAGLVPEALILRVSLVLGRTAKPGAHSMIDSMIRRWGAGEVLPASVIESRNPIDAPTLSQWMIELLADTKNRGLFNTGSTDSMTRYQLAQAIAKRAHVSPDLIRLETESPAGRAPRGLDHFLISTKISNTCATQPPSTNEVIERSFNEVAEGSLRTGV